VPVTLKKGLVAGTNEIRRGSPASSRRRPASASHKTGTAVDPQLKKAPVEAGDAIAASSSNDAAIETSPDGDGNLVRHH
jgi:hypothetical protein